MLRIALNCFIRTSTESFIRVQYIVCNTTRVVNEYDQLGCNSYSRHTARSIERRFIARLAQLLGAVGLAVCVRAALHRVRDSHPSQLQHGVEQVRRRHEHSQLPRVLLRVRAEQAVSL